MGHGAVYCFKEADKELTKRAFATAVRVKNAAGANVPPAVREDSEHPEPDDDTPDKSEPFALHIWGHAEGVPFSQDAWRDMRIVS